MTDDALDATSRERLAALADLLIPADGIALSASQADVHATGIDRVFGVRPDLLEQVRGMLADVGPGAPASFAELYELDSPHFSGFAEAVTGAYFLNPVVATRVGYSKRSVIPIVFDTDLDELVTAVTSRGTIYRPTPINR